MAGGAWYYVAGETRVGPVEKAEMERLAASGQITGATLVWTDGLSGWEEASAHFDLPASSGPPPLSQMSQAYQPEPDSAGGPAPARGMGDAVRVCLSKYATFSGRASRSEFWFFQLAVAIGGVVTSLVDAALFGAGLALSPINTLLSIAAFLPTLAVSFRRLHDTGRSGWIVGAFYILLGVFFSVAAPAIMSAPGTGATTGMAGLLSLGVLVYSVVLIVFFCLKGEPRANRYG